MSPLFRVIPTVLFLIPNPLQAQDPLSAINWLSDSVDSPVAVVRTARRPNEPHVAQNADVEAITVTPINNSASHAVGLLPVTVTGLPHDLWGASSSIELARLITKQPVDTLPALQELLRMLLLAEVDAPKDGDTDNTLFLARVDKLLDIGAVDQAQALLDMAGTTEPELFRRWFDVSLLNGTEDKACKKLINTPDIAPTMASRIFCLVQGGDYKTASLTFDTGKVLGYIQDDEKLLIERFLDPEMFDPNIKLTQNKRITPLVFRMSEAAGEFVPTAPLARVFANADLRSNVGWKAQIESAERLAATGAIDANRLLGLYSERKPSASGGVWERVAAVQAFDIAFRSQDANAVAKTLPMIWFEMQKSGLQAPFAALFGADLAKIPLSGVAGGIAFQMGLLSPDYEAIAKAHHPQNPMEKFLTALALGKPNDATAPNARAKSIAAGFSRDAQIPALEQLIGNQKLGEAILQALHSFAQGTSGNLDNARKALVLFRKIGLEDTARRAALEYMLLDNTR